MGWTYELCNLTMAPMAPMAPMAHLVASKILVYITVFSYAFFVCSYASLPGCMSQDVCNPYWTTGFSICLVLTIKHWGTPHDLTAITFDQSPEGSTLFKPAGATDGHQSRPSWTYWIYPCHVGLPTFVRWNHAEYICICVGYRPNIYGEVMRRKNHRQAMAEDKQWSFAKCGGGVSAETVSIVPSTLCWGLSPEIVDPNNPNNSDACFLLTMASRL